MKRFKLLMFVLFSLLFVACNSQIDTKPKDIKFDREVCERCKMIISDRNYAVQVINKNDGKRYYFDDIGCSILWFQENGLTWENDAIIYVTDAKNGEWLDAKKAYWTFGAVTPMNFGFSAFKDKQDGVENFDFSYVREKILQKPSKHHSGHHHNMGHHK